MRGDRADSGGASRTSRLLYLLGAHVIGVLVVHRQRLQQFRLLAQRRQRRDLPAVVAAPSPAGPAGTPAPAAPRPAPSPPAAVGRGGGRRREPASPCALRHRPGRRSPTACRPRRGEQAAGDAHLPQAGPGRRRPAPGRCPSRGAARTPAGRTLSPSCGITWRIVQAKAAAACSAGDSLSSLQRPGHVAQQEAELQVGGVQEGVGRRSRPRRVPPRRGRSAPSAASSAPSVRAGGPLVRVAREVGVELLQGGRTGRPVGGPGQDLPGRFERVLGARRAGSASSSVRSSRRRCSRTGHRKRKTEDKGQDQPPKTHDRRFLVIFGSFVPYPGQRLAQAEAAADQGGQLVQGDHVRAVAEGLVGRGCVSRNRPSQPQATAARARYGTMRRSPPLRSPGPPGICTL